MVDKVLTYCWDVGRAAGKPSANRARPCRQAGPTTSHLSGPLATATPHSQQGRRQAQVFPVTPG